MGKKILFCLKAQQEQAEKGPGSLESIRCCSLIHSHEHTCLLIMEERDNEGCFWHDCDSILWNPKQKATQQNGSVTKRLLRIMDWKGLFTFHLAKLLILQENGTTEKWLNASTCKLVCLCESRQSLENPVALFYSPVAHVLIIVITG